MDEVIFATLYRKNENGNLGYWDIEVVGNEIRTTWGILGGAEQNSCKRIDYWTNAGKANERDPEAQAQFEAEALWKKRKDNGYYSSRKAAMDETRRISVTGGIKPMKAQAFVNSTGKSFEHKIKYPCFVQPKYNGVRAVSTIENDQARLWSSGGKEYHSCKHVTKELVDVFPGHIKPDGEMYKHGWPLQKISGLVRRVNCHSLEDNALNYVVFDIVDFELPFKERIKILNEFASEWKDLDTPIQFAETVLVHNKEQAQALYEKWLAQGYEGMIYRNANLMYTQKRSMDMIKRKDFFDDEFKIVGYTEGTGKLEGCLASFICVTPCGNEFDAPMNGTHEYLRKVWKERDAQIGKNLTVRYLELSVDNIPQIPKGLVNGLHVRPKGE